jgi:hypothetical protein
MAQALLNLSLSLPHGKNPDEAMAGREQASAMYGQIGNPAAAQTPTSDGASHAGKWANTEDAITHAEDVIEGSCRCPPQKEIGLDVP